MFPGKCKVQFEVAAKLNIRSTHVMVGTPAAHTHSQQCFIRRHGCQLGSLKVYPCTLIITLLKNPTMAKVTVQVQDQAPLLGATTTRVTYRDPVPISTVRAVRPQVQVHTTYIKSLEGILKFVSIVSAYRVLVGIGIIIQLI